MNTKNFGQIETDIVAKETLYVSNLNDKIKLQGKNLSKELIIQKEMKINLYYIFIQFGDIIEIVCRQTKQLRGQAFIIYANTNQASLALKSLQGVNFLGKPLKIQFAQNRSNILIQQETGNMAPTQSKKLLKVQLKQKMVQGPQKKVKTDNDDQQNENKLMTLLKESNEQV